MNSKKLFVNDQFRTVRNKVLIGSQGLSTAVERRRCQNRTADTGTSIQPTESSIMQELTALPPCTSTAGLFKFGGFTLPTYGGYLARPFGGLRINFDHVEIFRHDTEVSATQRFLTISLARLQAPRSGFEAAIWGSASRCFAFKPLGRLLQAGEKVQPRGLEWMGESTMCS